MDTYEAVGPAHSLTLTRKTTPEQGRNENFIFRVPEHALAFVLTHSEFISPTDMLEATTYLSTNATQKAES
ncbi:hypothetical protein GCM10027413_30820 [Conyzicola nivalis]